MNKLMGFFELQNSDIPTIPWKEYTENTKLDESILWTVRTAVLKGKDFDLPRLIGAKADEAHKFACEMLRDLSKTGMVIYYPYFVAEKSGNLNIYNDKIIIEAVKDDLWNLVTYSDREVTITITNNEVVTYGNTDFITEDELQKILANIPHIKSMFRQYLLEDKSVLLEWSYAYNCDLQKNILGDKYLVFYEARTV